MFLKEVLQKLHLFDQKTVILWKIITILKTIFHFNIVYSCDGKAEFSAVFTVLIWQLICSRTFNIII